MPAIQVARTDTFEVQRQKINEIGSQIFNVTAGGSDLSTGNLKLGDGTRLLPSLAFVNDASLGIYRSGTSTLGYVASGKKLAEFSADGFYSYQNFTVRKNVLSGAGLTFLDYGQNYDPGTYTDIPLIGGTGTGATATVTVTEYDGTINSNGANYTAGSFTQIYLSGGSGSDATANFSVEGIIGSITNGGSGYAPGNYSNISLSGGSGSGVKADVTISGTATYAGNISVSGGGYTDAVYSGVPVLNVPTQTFTVTAISNPGSPPPDNVYSINGSTQPVLSLLKGNTYRFDISDTSLATHPLSFREVNGNPLPSSFQILNVGSAGSAGAFIDLIILPEADLSQIEYYCMVHAGMGNTATLSSGSLGSYGYNATAEVTVSGGSVTGFVFETPGQRYKSGDTLEVLSVDIGGTGTGFRYLITGGTFNGEVTSISITDVGQSYQLGDVLSIDVSNNIFNNSGAGFQYTLENTPGLIKDFEFIDKGTGYQVGDLLQLSGEVTGVSAILPGIVSDVNTTLSTSSAQITVASTTGILQGMVVFNGGSDTGLLAQNTTVLSVDSSTQLTLSANPDVDGAASLTFQSQNLSSFDVPSSAGIYQNFIVSVSSGTGQLLEGTTVTSVSGNTINIDNTPSFPGDAVLTFTPPYGVPTTEFEFEITVLGPVSDFNLTEGGNGYSENDEISINETDLTQPISYSVIVKSVKKLNFVNTVSDSLFSVGDFVKVTDGTITSVPLLTASTLIAFGTNYTAVASTTNGSGIGATFDVARDAQDGTPIVTINNGGKFYADGDVVTISGSLVGGSSPADDITFTVSANELTSNTSTEIFDIFSSGGNIDYIFVEDTGIFAGENIINVTTGTFVEYAVDQETFVYKYYIDTGSGYSLHPNLTLLVGNTYTFDLSDTTNTNHVFSLSEYRDGVWSPSLIENISTVFDVQSTTLTLTSTSGILPGMTIDVDPSSTGQLIANTTVVSVDSATEITISALPLTAGNATLTFVGSEYTNGVTRTASSLTVKILDNTPSTLYYYCAAHPDMAGEDNLESSITVDSNNPKVFGSGFLARASEIASTDLFAYDITSQRATTTAVSTVTLEATTATLANITSTSLSSQDITTPLINGVGNLLTLSSGITKLTGDLEIASTVTIEYASGDITTPGVIKTLGSLNVNDVTFIENNRISCAPNNDIELLPPTGKIVKVISNTAFALPFGTTSDRPVLAAGEGNGYIRFNTETSQYEGYSQSTTSWSSLGGVRDLDGNTYISAEETVGANDNRLWFYNDGINTVRFTPTYLEFMGSKKIRSLNTAAPSYREWVASDVATVGEYIKYKNNVYEVTAVLNQGGSNFFATSGNEPVHTSGAVYNGDIELTWYVSAVSPLTFEEISEIRISDDVPTLFGGDLRIVGTTISSDITDITIKPNSGRRIICDSRTHLQIPSGTDNEKSTGTAALGSIRYNTTLSTYEGYIGNQKWGSLGGVKDVDGNTYIIPETAPAANENILYFYNDNINTINVSTTAVDFANIDTITSSGSNSLEVTASVITLDNSSTTIDNTGSSTFISTTKDNLDLGASSGLSNDVILRLSDAGDVYFNTGFGSGSQSLVKIFDSDLSSLEISKYRVTTSSSTLVKGTNNNGSAVIYSPSLELSAKVEFIVHNTTTGAKELVEFSVIDKGSDIFYTEVGTLRTDSSLIDYTFDFNVNNDVRLNYSLSTGVANANSVNVTVVSNVIKK